MAEPFGLEEAQRLVREENHLHLPKDDPVMALVTLLGKFQQIQADQMEAAVADCEQKFSALIAEMRSSMKEAVGDLNEAALNSSLKQVLAEVSEKARQIDGAYQGFERQAQGIEAALAAYDTAQRRRGRWLSGVMVFSTLCIGLAAGVVIFQ